MKNAPEADFLNMWTRIRRSGLQNELLIRAAKPERQRAAKGAEVVTATDVRLTAIDATAGFGEDAFLLAAAGYDVTMYERNPAVAAVLRDALSCAAAAEAAETAGRLKFGGAESGFRDVIARMHLVESDSTAAMQAMVTQVSRETSSDGDAGNEPKASADDSTMRIDVIYLDPMFPDAGKSALSKKKLQFIKEQQVSAADEEALLQAALALRPRKIIIKRPLKGPFLCGVTPGYSIKGKLIQYDCIVL